MEQSDFLITHIYCSMLYHYNASDCVTYSKLVKYVISQQDKTFIYAFV